MFVAVAHGDMGPDIGCSGGPHRLKAWRLGIFGLTLLAHVIIVALFLSRLFDSSLPTRPVGNAAITIMSLPGPPEAPPEQHPPAPLVEAQPSEVDQIQAVETPVLPPEWTVTKIKVARAEAPAIAQVPSQPAKAGAFASAYDPYAGAAPLRTSDGKQGAQLQMAGAARITGDHAVHCLPGTTPAQAKSLNCVLDKSPPSNGKF